MVKVHVCKTTLCIWFVINKTYWAVMVITLDCMFPHITYLFDVEMNVYFVITLFERTCMIWSRTFYPVKTFLTWLSWKLRFSKINNPHSNCWCITSYRAKANSCNCLLFKKTDTAVCLCTACDSEDGRCVRMRAGCLRSRHVWIQCLDLAVSDWHTVSIIPASLGQLNHCIHPCLHHRDTAQKRKAGLMLGNVVIRWTSVQPALCEGT